MPQSSWRNIATSLRPAARGAMRSVSLALALILLANNCLPQTVNSQQLQLQQQQQQQQKQQQQQQSQLPQAIITASDNSYQEQQPVEQQQQPMEAYPHYMQSPLVPNHNQNQNQNQNEAEASKQQRSNVRMGHLPPVSGYMKSTARSSSPPVSTTPTALATSAPVPPATTSNDSQRSYTSANNNNNYQYEPAAASPTKPAPQPQPQPRPQASQTTGCLYDKQYFLKLDQCLERRPYPTIGLAAFKNDDLVVKKGLSDKHGCSFILTNGLFKSFQVSRYSLDSDTQCLDQDQMSQLSVQFSNVTLYYLWQLRCLNYANQLLHDATLEGKTLSNSIYPNDSARSGHGAGNNGGGSSGPICVGSSQSFGFAALQLSNIEAQVELSIDIYKNWRVTNVTVAMMSPGSSKLADHQQAAPNPGDYSHEQPQQQQQQSHTGGDRPATSIKAFTFDTIDGDELNWRYSHLYENWTRNRLHVNFLDQFKRFLWVSLQRCLSESSERLPVKLNDLFASHKYY